jgi:hypothetical protein
MSVYLKIIAILATIPDIIKLVRLIQDVYKEAKEAPNPEAAKAILKHIIVQEKGSAKEMAAKLENVRFKIGKIGVKKSGKKPKKLAAQKKKTK